MFQPFEIVKPVFINKLVELKRHFLVSQTYRRAAEQMAAEQTIDLLITDYSDPGLAKGHFNALRRDRYAAVIDLSKKTHQQKIREMLDPSSGYRLFWAVVKSKKELEHRLNTKYKDHMRRYIANHTTWRIGANATIVPDLQLIYGDLFIILKHGNERRRLTFEELEKS